MAIGSETFAWSCGAAALSLVAGAMGGAGAMATRLRRWGRHWGRRLRRRLRLRCLHRRRLHHLPAGPEANSHGRPRQPDLRPQNRSNPCHVSYLA